MSCSCRTCTARAEGREIILCCWVCEKPCSTEAHAVCLRAEEAGFEPRSPQHASALLRAAEKGGEE